MSKPFSLMNRIEKQAILWKKNLQRKQVYPTKEPTTGTSHELSTNLEK